MHMRPSTSSKMRKHARPLASSSTRRKCAPPSISLSTRSASLDLVDYEEMTRARPSTSSTMRRRARPLTLPSTRRRRARPSTSSSTKRRSARPLASILRTRVGDVDALDGVRRAGGSRGSRGGEIFWRRAAKLRWKKATIISNVAIARRVHAPDVEEALPQRRIHRGWRGMSITTADIAVVEVAVGRAMMLRLFCGSKVRNSSNEFFIVRFIILELCPGPLDDLDRFNRMIQLSSTILSFIVLEIRAWTRKVTKKEFFFKSSMIYHLSFSKIEHGRVLTGTPNSATTNY